MSAADIIQPADRYVVVSSHSLRGHDRLEHPERDEVLAWETPLTSATREAAQQRAAEIERHGYGPCRIARLVFED